MNKTNGQKAAKAQMSSEDFDALLELDLLDVVGLRDKNEEKQQQYMQKVNELTLVLLIQEDPDIGNLTTNHGEIRLDDAERYLHTRYEDPALHIAAKAALAKELVIAQYLGKLLLIAEEKNRQHNELSNLIKLVKHQKWSEFQKKYMILTKLRPLLHG